MLAVFLPFLVSRSATARSSFPSLFGFSLLISFALVRRRRLGGGDQRTRRACGRGRGEREHEHVAVVRRGGNSSAVAAPLSPLSFAVGRLRAEEPASSSSSSPLRSSVHNCSLLSSRRHVLLLQPRHHFRRAPGRADGQRASALGHEVPWLRSRHNTSSSSSSKTWASGLERRAGAVGPIRAEEGSEGRSSSARRARALLNTARCNPESCD